MILRDRDITSGWSGGVDGTLEDRVYHCQNSGGWRADVAGLTNAYGEQVETAKYSSYGTPFCLPAGDVDADGDNSGDYNQINTWIGLSQYHERADLNMDGVLDSADADLAFDADGTSGGRGVLSTEVVGNRKGYAGYENDGAVTRFAHVRHRVLDLGDSPLAYSQGVVPQPRIGSAKRSTAVAVGRRSHQHRSRCPGDRPASIGSTRTRRPVAVRS